MGFTYRIDEARRLIFVKASGSVTARDLALHWLQFIEDPRASALRRTLVDMTEADILIDLQDMHFLLESLVKPRIGDTTWTAALVVRDWGSRELARNLELLSRSFGRNRVFDDPYQAMEWLQLQSAGDGRR